MFYLEFVAHLSYLAFLSVPYLFRYTFTEDGSLHVRSAQVTDTGRYLCMATNRAGTHRRRVDLQVYGGWYTCAQEQ